MRPFVLVVLVLTALPSFAEDLTAEAMKALEDTQAVLRNPTLRALQPEAQSPDGARLMQQIQALGGSAQDNEALFQIAAEVMGDITREAHGDPDQMQRILEDAKKNPQGFARRLSPKEQQEIRDLAGKLPDPGSKKLP